MTYGLLAIDTIQSSTTGTPTQFQDGSGTQIGTLCRAWVSFVGSTAVINASFNVSSITRAGTGAYTVNFTNALADANYSSLVTSTQRGGSGSPGSNLSVGYGNGSTSNSNGTYSTSALQIYVQSSTGGVTDAPTVSVAVFR